jgi:hypothetical protein
MSGVRGPAVVLCVLAAVAAPGVFAQSAPLNPTVRVLEKPQSIVPTDCDEGLAPASPRPAPVELAALEPIEPRNVPPPPASDLRTRLRRVQTAAENGDYASFKSALDEARSGVSGYPGGGEKQSAADVLQVYGDLERLWDYAMTSPTGSFFDASSADGAIINALRRYPEFPRAVADATMNIGGQSVYPTTETRKFLTEEAAKRLRSLGVRTPSRVVQETPVPRVTPRPAPVPRSTTTKPQQSSKPRATPKATTPSTARKTQKQKAPRIVEKPAIAKPTPPPPVKVARVEPKPAPQPQPVPPPQPQPTPQPEPVTETTVTTATTATETAAPLSTDTTPTTDTTTSSAAPVETATTATEAPKPAPEKTPSRGVNLPFAIILIVIGIAVLVLLFRSSD